jgi:hypothetical protein
LEAAGFSKVTGADMMKEIKQFAKEGGASEEDKRWLIKHIVDNNNIQNKSAFMGMVHRFPTK